MSQTLEQGFGPGLFDKTNMTYYPPGMYIIPWIVTGVVAWFLSTATTISGFPGPGVLLLASTGIAGYLFIPLAIGGSIVGYGLLTIIREYLYWHGQYFLPQTMRFEGNIPPLTVPFVGQLVEAPSNIPGLTAPIVETGKDGKETITELPPTTLGFYAFMADVYIPQALSFPRFWLKYQQPVDRIYYLSQWSLSQVNKKWPMWVGCKRLLLPASNVCPIDTSLYRGKQYLQNEKVIPLFQITGCQGTPDDTQRLAKVKFLKDEIVLVDDGRGNKSFQNKQLLQVEGEIRHDYAMQERLKREAVESELSTMKRNTPKLFQMVGDQTTRLKGLRAGLGQTDAVQGRLGRFFASRTGTIIILGILFSGTLVAVILASHR